MRVLWRWWRLPARRWPPQRGRPHAAGAPASLVKDGDSITVGDIEVKVIHTPGHTLGRCATWREASIHRDHPVSQAGPVGAGHRRPFSRSLRISPGSSTTLPDDTASCPATVKTAPGHLQRGVPQLLSKNPPRGPVAETSSGWRVEGSIAWKSAHRQCKRETVQGPSPGLPHRVP